MHNILSKMFLFLFLFFSTLYTMLIFQIKRIISSEKCFNYVVTSSSSFFENAKNLSRPATTLNGEKKKEGSLSRVAISTRRSWVAFAFFAFGSIRAPQKSYTLRQNPFSNQGGESDPFWSSSRFILFFVRGKGVRGQGPGCIWLIRYRYLFF